MGTTNHTFFESVRLFSGGSRWNWVHFDQGCSCRQHPSEIWDFLDIRKVCNPNFLILIQHQWFDCACTPLAGAVLPLQLVSVPCGITTHPPEWWMSIPAFLMQLDLWMNITKLLGIHAADLCKVSSRGWTPIPPFEILLCWYERSLDKFKSLDKRTVHSTDLGRVGWSWKRNERFELLKMCTAPFNCFWLSQPDFKLLTHFNSFGFLFMPLSRGLVSEWVIPSCMRPPPHKSSKPSIFYDTACHFIKYSCNFQ